jgi:hypothetical protein
MSALEKAALGLAAGGNASSTTPLMDGTAAVGTSANYARGDHVHPSDTSRLGPGVSSNLTAGFTATADAITTPASGTTVTPSQAFGDYHTLTNNGAFTLNPPSLTGPANCASGVIEVYNGASAGTITVSGWTKVAGSFSTTASHAFQCDYCITPRGSFLNIRAMQ